MPVISFYFEAQMPGSHCPSSQKAAQWNQNYFRITVAFETAAANYAWLNSAAFVGTGDRTPSGPIYDVFEVL